MWHHLATTGMGRKLGAVPLWGGGAGPPSISVALAEAYLRTKLHLDPFSRLATVDMDRGRVRKFRTWGLLCAPFRGGELGPHLII